MSESRVRRAELVALGNAVRARRLEFQLTQEDLAAAASITTRYLSDLENGQANPTVEVVLAIAEALSTTASALLKRAEADTSE